jgi:hypothetical protein
MAFFVQAHKVGVMMPILRMQENQIKKLEAEILALKNGSSNGAAQAVGAESAPPW